MQDALAVLALLALHRCVPAGEDFTSGLAARWPAEGAGIDVAAQWHGRLQDVTFGPGRVGLQAFRLANSNHSAVLSILARVNPARHGRSDYDGFGRTIISRTEGGGLRCGSSTGRCNSTCGQRTGRFTRKFIRNLPAICFRHEAGMSQRHDEPGRLLVKQDAPRLMEPGGYKKAAKTARAPPPPWVPVSLFMGQLAGNLEQLANLG